VAAAQDVRPAKRYGRTLQFSRPRLGRRWRQVYATTSTHRQAEAPRTPGSAARLAS
jgi:hypothetical protein